MSTKSKNIQPNKKPTQILGAGRKQIIRTNIKSTIGIDQKIYVQNHNTQIVSKPIGILNKTKQEILPSSLTASLTRGTKTTTSTAGKTFRKPELHSTCAITDKIHQIKSVPVKNIENINQLTPRTKQFLIQQVSHKLNFQYDKTVFKDLMAINVNDSVLELPTVGAGADNFDYRFQMNNKMRKPFVRNTIDRDPEPQLIDYLKPIKLLKHKLILSDYPDSILMPAQSSQSQELNNHDRLNSILDSLNL